MTPPPMPLGNDAESSSARPRVEGEREQEILDATLDVLADVGYDRLTMDAVATAAKASKATLYRRFSSKAELVIEALISQKEPHALPDTGSLRGDLLSAYCGMGGLTDQRQTAILGSVITAIGRDDDFAERFRRDFIGPKAAQSEFLFRRARERGEVADGVDLDVVAPALAAVVLHRQFLFGQMPDAAFIARVVDQIVLPAVTAGPHPPSPTNQRDHS